MGAHSPGARLSLDLDSDWETGTRTRTSKEPTGGERSKATRFRPRRSSSDTFEFRPASSPEGTTRTTGEHLAEPRARCTRNEGRSDGWVGAGERTNRALGRFIDLALGSLELRCRGQPHKVDPADRTRLAGMFGGEGAPSRVLSRVSSRRFCTTMNTAGRRLLLPSKAHPIRDWRLEAGHSRCPLSIARVCAAYSRRYWMLDWPVVENERTREAPVRGFGFNVGARKNEERRQQGTRWMARRHKIGMYIER